MRTSHTAGGGKRGEHPVDLLRAFAARMAVFTELSNATLQAHEVAAMAGIGMHLELSEEIARSLWELGADFHDMNEAVGKWFDSNAAQGGGAQ